MVSIKDFARDNGVSYEAVRKQIKRYAAELDGHIHQQGRTQYLDDVAVAFLQEHRSKPAMAIYDERSDPRVQELEQQLSDMFQTISALGQSNAKLSEANADLMQFKLNAMEQQRQLEAHEERLEEREQAIAGEISAAREEAIRATEERFRSMSLLDFLRERKKKGL